MGQAKITVARKQKTHPRIGKRENKRLIQSTNELKKR